MSFCSYYLHVGWNWTKLNNTLCLKGNCNAKYKLRKQKENKGRKISVGTVGNHW